MHRWMGFLGSWALFALGFGLASIAAAGQWINFSDARRLRRYALVDELLDERMTGTVHQLRGAKAKSERSIDRARSDLGRASTAIDESRATGQTIIVSTAENRLYVRKDNATVFKALCSTGKLEPLVDGSRIKVFRTPIGKFKIRSKEVNPVWIPPDWHFVEEALKNKLKVVRLERGQALDADTGQPARMVGGGMWAWVGASSGSRRVITVKNETVVEIHDGVERELPPGQFIRAGGTLVVPPVGTPQRRLDKVLGAFRLNLGDGYALHGTQALNQLGRSVSHGCVRLGDADIAALYRMASVGDEVIIY